MLICLLLVGLSTVPAQPGPPFAPSPTAGLFPEDGHEGAIDFWVAVFSRHGRDELLIHDRFVVDMVYEVVRVDGTPPASPAAREARQREVRQLLERWAKRLRALSEAMRTGSDPGTAGRQLLARLQATMPEESRDWQTVAGLADRLRAQRGIRERMRQAWVDSGRYLTHMEAIFRQEGIPLELLALPFFESSFELGSRSHRGATGVWQFIQATGRQYMRVDNRLDERLDPLHSTRAAARYLRQAYARLGSWPLAVMSYHHGINGIARARARLGNDPMAIIRHYESRSFGFASRNYYPEFLATLRLLREPDTHFQGLQRAAPWQFRETVLAAPLRVDTAMKRHGLDRETFLAYNPSVRVRGPELARLTLPQGWRLRLPPAGATAASTTPAPPVARPTTGPPASHLVRSGENLYRIALRYGVTVEDLRRWNGLRGDVIRSGQRLRLTPPAP